MTTRTLLRLLPASMLAIAATVAIARIASTGAPEASTGAPSERTCAAGGCHDDKAVGSGNGSVTLQVGYPGTTGFQSGVTYPVTVSIRQDSLVRFGFQVTAVSALDGNSAGSIILTDSVRTQAFNGEIFFPKRQYVTYTYAGTSALQTGLSTWSFNWKAPENNVGDVTFYLGAVGANNDGTDKGDCVYLLSKNLLQHSASAVYEPRVNPFIVNQSSMDLR